MFYFYQDTQLLSKSKILITNPKAITGGETHLNINFKYRVVLMLTFETLSSSLNFPGTTQPIKKATKNPPKISKTLNIESNVPRNVVSSAEGIPNINTNTVTRKTDLFLLKPNLSIKDETGTSNKETEEVMAAI